MNASEWNLDRFVHAQHPIFDEVKSELNVGRKRGHWMWFIFPQMSGLGRSPMSQRYGIRSLDEAIAYSQHPILGPRLLECAQRVIEAEANDPYALLGSQQDVKKLRSSMTLFALATPERMIFQQVLDKYYGGKLDDRTLALLRIEP